MPRQDDTSVCRRLCELQGPCRARWSEDVESPKLPLASSPLGAGLELGKLVSAKWRALDPRRCLRRVARGWERLSCALVAEADVERPCWLCVLPLGQYLM